MTDNIESIDLSEEQDIDNYKRVYQRAVKPSFKKPLSPVAHVSPSGFRMPRSLDDIIAGEKASKSTSEDGEIPIMSKSEVRERESRPATNPFAQQPPRSSKSTSPIHGDFGGPTNASTNVGSMAYYPDATPSKKRRIDSLANNTPSGNAPPQWAPNSPFSASTNINTPYQPVTPVRTPARAPAQHGIFSKQARSQRNGTPAALQPPPPGLDPQADFIAAVSNASPLLNNLDTLFLRPLRDLAKEQNSLKAEISQVKSENQALKTENQDLKNELATLRQHVDASFTDQASKAQKAVSDVNAKVEELHERLDDLEGGGEPVPGGAYGGPRMTGPTRQPSVFNGLLGSNDGA